MVPHAFFQFLSFLLPQAGILPDDLVGLPDSILRETFPELFEEGEGDDAEDYDDEGSNLPEGINLANLPAGITVSTGQGSCHVDHER